MEGGRLGHIFRRANLNGEEAGVIAGGFTVKCSVRVNNAFTENHPRTRLFFFFCF